MVKNDRRSVTLKLYFGSQLVIETGGRPVMVSWISKTSEEELSVREKRIVQSLWSKNIGV